MLSIAKSWAKENTFPCERHHLVSYCHIFLTYYKCSFKVICTHIAGEIVITIKSIPEFQFKKILCLPPPYHYELNPTELIWAQAKSNVARNSTNYELPDLTNLFYKSISEGTTESWSLIIL